MTTNARKTDAQRLGNGKKAFNVKQVEKMIEQGGGGTEYTAGTGIVIADDTISVDEQTVAMKSEIPDTLTALTPININAQNQINLKDWVLVPNSERTALRDESEGKARITEDIIVMVAATGGVPTYRVTYLPKDTCIYNYEDILINNSSDFPQIGTYRYRSVIINNITDQIYYKASSISKQQSGKNERLQFTIGNVIPYTPVAYDTEGFIPNSVKIYRRA